MPLALFIMMVLYVWLVLRRTRGDAGKGLSGEEATRAEKVMRFVRVGLVVASVVLVASIILASSRQGIAPPATSPTGGTSGGASGLANAFNRVGGFFGLHSQAAALPFFVIVGTAVSYGYTIIASAKTYGFHRWLRHRRMMQGRAS